MTELAEHRAEWVWGRGRLARLLRAVAQRPRALFILLSTLFGVPLILLNPPLRGPDEPAHFVRIYAYASGVILPKVAVEGRKGFYLPAAMHDEFAFFNEIKGNIWIRGFSYRTVLAQHLERRASQQPTSTRAPVFVPFEGTEGYTLVGYAPHVAAGVLAKSAGLGFAESLYLMRLAGLAFFTGIVGYAIGMTPWLKWAFFLIGMLPATLYGRCVLGADGAAVGFSFVVVAMSLRAIAGLRSRWERPIWMTLCVLSKPPQIVFVLLELACHDFRDLKSRWRTIAAVIVPGLVLAPLWIWLVGAEMAAWRLYSSGSYAREHFTLLWKLRFMADNPLHFPTVMAATLFGETFGLWRQLIGVLGWLDTHLNTWIYAAITGLLLMTMCERLAIDTHQRLRLVVWSLAVVVSYTIIVFFILFVTWTPPTEEVVWGVQGRYFVCILPLAAVVVSSLLAAGLQSSILAGVAIVGAVISGVATVEAVWRVNWLG